MTLSNFVTLLATGNGVKQVGWNEFIYMDDTQGKFVSSLRGVIPVEVVFETLRNGKLASYVAPQFKFLYDLASNPGVFITSTGHYVDIAAMTAAEVVGPDTVNTYRRLDATMV